MSNNSNCSDLSSNTSESHETEQDDEITNEYFDPLTFFTSKELRYYKMIDNFFINCPQESINKMVDIIDKKCEMSLRILDWFVCKHSKKRIDNDFEITKDLFDVHISYKAQLKSFKKKYFDPFRRKKKFYYNYDKTDDTKKMYTTLGQLNFFKWAISNNIINYVEKNISKFTRAMNVSNKEEKKKKENKKINVKSNKINVSASKIIKDDQLQIILNFD